MDVLYNSTFVVGISFFLFIGLLVYVGVPGMLGKMLDDRADKIRTDLDEAKRLREEAQELHAEFERKQRDVQEQAEDIVAHAKAEAEAAAAKAHADLEIAIERRLKAADEQIALAESEAVRQVKDMAVTVAIDAATQVIGQHMDDEKTNALVDASINDLGARLH